MTRYEYDCFYAPTNWVIRLVVGSGLIGIGGVAALSELPGAFVPLPVAAGLCLLFMALSCAENRAHNKRFAEQWKARFINIRHDQFTRRMGTRQARLKAMNDHQKAYLAWAFADFRGRPEDYLDADPDELLRLGNAYDSND